MRDDKFDALRGRAERALGNQRVADAVQKVRAIVGPANIPASEPRAQSALDKLRNGEANRLTAEEILALEIVVRLLRPVVLSRNGRLDDLPEDPAHPLHPPAVKTLWDAFRNRVQPMIDSIGRIETTTRRSHAGTGFLVADGLLATNRHVLGILTLGAEVLPAGTAQVVFKQESGLVNRPEDVVPLDGVAAIHPRLDLVLLRLRAQNRGLVTLDPAPITQSTRVVTIGYPGHDPVNNPLFLSGVFGNKFGFRCAALGEVMDGVDSPAFFHDCSTTQGNSGSPIFSLESGKVTGIHSAGFFMYRNQALDADQLKKFIAQPPG